MNSTIDYYNNNAVGYFANTLHIDFEEIYMRFLAYVPEGGKIMDLGCGSGRDVKWFSDHGYEAYGLDASEELAELAANTLGIRVGTGLIEEWISEVPFDGIWCCASLMHLSDTALAQFINNLGINLSPGGVLFVSVKTGIETGNDDQGRYLRNFTEEDIHELIKSGGQLRIEELWYTEDKLSRNNVKWLNVIIVKK